VTQGGERDELFKEERNGKPKKSYLGREQHRVKIGGRRSLNMERLASNGSPIAREACKEKKGKGSSKPREREMGVLLQTLGSGSQRSNKMPTEDQIGFNPGKP